MASKQSANQSARTGSLDRHPRSGSKRRVCLGGDPELQGTVVSEGPEQSVVRWDNGNETAVVNSWIAPIPSAPLDAMPVATPPASAKTSKRNPAPRRSNETSKAAKIRRAFDENGLEAAVELGRTLGYYASTVRRLAAKWQQQR